MSISIQNTIVVPANGTLYSPFKLAPKTSLESITYCVDLSSRLNDGDFIKAVKIQTNSPALVTSDPIIIDNTFTFIASAGTDNTIPIIFALVSTALGEVRQITMSLEIFIPISKG